MKVPTIDQRNYYANRAVEARALIEVERDPKMVAALRESADSYNKLVAEADRIASIRARINIRLDPSNCVSKRMRRPSA